MSQIPTQFDWFIHIHKDFPALYKTLVHNGNPKTLFLVGKTYNTNDIKYLWSSYLIGFSLAPQCSAREGDRFYVLQTLGIRFRTTRHAATCPGVSAKWQDHRLKPFWIDFRVENEVLKPVGFFFPNFSKSSPSFGASAQRGASFALGIARRFADSCLGSQRGGLRWRLLQISGFLHSSQEVNTPLSGYVYPHPELYLWLISYNIYIYTHIYMYIYICVGQL